MSTAILDNPEFRRRVSPLSVEEYHRLSEYNENGRRTELIRGIIIEKMAKSPLHRTMATRLYRLILSKLPAGFIAWKEEPLTLNDSEPEPDISVARGTEQTFEKENANTAVLVVEIAVTSIAEDRELAAVYAEAGVGEYWIVLPRERQIEVYRFPEAGAYREMQTVREGALECAGIAGVIVVLDELFR